MKRLCSGLAGLCALCAPVLLPADPGSAFTYQGYFEEDGVPFNGSVDASFSLYENPSTPTSVAGPRDFAGVSVEDGVFSVTLDFGPDPYMGQILYLGVTIDPDGAAGPIAPQEMEPRMRLGVEPYARYAVQAEGLINPISSLHAPDEDPRDAVTVDGDGRVGIGTYAPQEELHVVGSIKLSDEPVPDVVQLDSNTSNFSVFIQQTFQPGQSGLLGSVGFGFTGGNNNGEGEFKLYEGEGFAGTLLATQPYSFPTRVEGIFTVQLNPPPALVSGQTYTLVFDAMGPVGHLMQVSDANPYPSGLLLNAGDPDKDLVFTTGMVTPGSDHIEFPDGSIQTTAFTGIVDDADADETNELQDLDGVLSLGNQANGQDVTGVGELDAATVTSGQVDAGQIEFPDGSVQTTAFTGFVDDADADSTNELQNLDGVLSLGNQANGQDVLGVGELDAITVTGRQVDTDEAVVANRATVAGQMYLGGAGATLGSAARVAYNQSGLQVGTRPIVKAESMNDAGVGFFFGSFSLWQSFTIQESGDLMAIEVRLTNSPAALATLYEGEGTSGRVLAQAWIPESPGTSFRIQTAAWPEAVPVSAGQQYSIHLTSASVIRWSVNVNSGGLAYPDGRASSDPDGDFYFSTYLLDSTSDSDFETVLHVDTESQSVGVRTSSPRADLEILQTETSASGPAGALFATGSNFWKTYHSGSHFSFAENGVRRVYIQAGTGNYVQTSDAGLKEDIAPLAGSLSRASAMQPVRYRYKSQPDDGQLSLGFLAQDVAQLFPELVHEGEDGMLGISYAQVSVVAIAALKELKAEKDAEISALREDVIDLSDRNSELEERIGRLEALMGD